MLQIIATGVCHMMPTPWKVVTPRSVPMYCVLGHEGSGIVESVNRGVTSVKPGEHAYWRKTLS